MNLPYGISDFEKIRKNNLLYVDKTGFIPTLEDLGYHYVFFMRPRGFGKSLFLSMLESYYDINAREEFDSLFSDLYIGQNPTPLKNRYLVLHIDFSGLNTDNEETLQKSFNMRVADSVRNFITKYEEFITDTTIVNQRIDSLCEATDIMHSLFGAIKFTGKKIYLIVDEYDQFANNIIAMGESNLYKNIGRTLNFVRNFYTVLKIGTESVIDRIFITGVSPLSMDNLTSGFNIAANLTLDEELNEMLGFTEEELDSIIEQLGLNKDNLGVNLEEYYNGYLFNSRCSKRVYNPDMILYYFSNYITTGKLPNEFIDDSVKSNYARIERLVGNEENKKVLEEIIKNEGISASIDTIFWFDTMYDSDYFVSLLFYMGMLTIDRRERLRLLLKIPNYVTNTICWEHIGKRLSRE